MESSSELMSSLDDEDGNEDDDEEDDKDNEIELKMKMKMKKMMNLTSCQPMWILLLIAL